MTPRSRTDVRHLIGGLTDVNRCATSAPRPVWEQTSVPLSAMEVPAASSWWHKCTAAGANDARISSHVPYCV
eukprot:1374467-Pyramimonas_sp.AAC.1